MLESTNWVVGGPQGAADAPRHEALDAAVPHAQARYRASAVELIGLHRRRRARRPRFGTTWGWYNAGVLPRRNRRRCASRSFPCIVLTILSCLALAAPTSLDARAGQAKGASSAKPQQLDEAYTAKIKEHTTDPRVITELVDHLPASDTVPTPLKFFGRIPGTPDELTYSKDIYRYFDALDAASDRVKVFRIGKTEEGREMITVVVADEATIRTLDKWKRPDREADRFADDARRRSARARSRRPSRSTTSPERSTRPRPAAPRC